jgi:hypothetical protein
MLLKSPFSRLRWRQHGPPKRSCHTTSLRCHNPGDHDLNIRRPENIKLLTNVMFIKYEIYFVVNVKVKVKLPLCLIKYHAMKTYGE